MELRETVVAHSHMFARHQNHSTRIFITNATFHIVSNHKVDFIIPKNEFLVFLTELGNEISEQKIATSYSQNRNKDLENPSTECFTS